MLKSLIGAVILVVSIPTVGYLAAGLVCFLMGLANVPGYKIWRSGVARMVQLGQRLIKPSIDGFTALRGVRQARLAIRFGMFLAWVGQSAVSLLFAGILIQFTKFFFSHFEFWYLFRWLYWVAIFFLCLAPSYRTLRIAEESSTEQEKPFYRYTLSLTCLTTAICFIVLAFI
ncbi:MAG: hypothetical protein WAK60_06860 [Sedimentisphaerales bacterium]